jgi:hypothetical protein
VACQRQQARADHRLAEDVAILLGPITAGAEAPARGHNYRGDPDILIQQCKMSRYPKQLSAHGFSASRPTRKRAFRAAAPCA